MILAQDERWPVSYTHLDVYKRQVMQNIMRVFSVVLLIMVGTVFAVGPAGPVSYTHLDVYKRQVRGRWAFAKL